jgi:hypothetical protein
MYALNTKNLHEPQAPIVGPRVITLSRLVLAEAEHVPIEFVVNPLACLGVQLVCVNLSLALLPDVSDANTRC